MRVPAVATDRATGLIVEIGDTVMSFRGEPAILTYVSRAGLPGKSGKVCVRAVDAPDDTFSREYYDKVFNLKVVSILSCGCVVSEDADCVHPEWGVAAGVTA